MDNYSRLLQESEQVPQVQGIVPTDMLELPDNLAAFLRMLMRKGPMSAATLATHLDVTEDKAKHLGDRLVTKGYLLVDASNEEEGHLYRIFYARMRKQNIPSQLL